tara:strand:- start:19 stop:780 length:762 start_codon:yes stop_codon:yes gene_type:complete
MSELNFTHSNGNKVKLTTPDTLAANRTFKLPGADGTAGQVLQTDGNGNLTFVDQKGMTFLSSKNVASGSAADNAFHFNNVFSTTFTQYMVYFDIFTPTGLGNVFYAQFGTASNGSITTGYQCRGGNMHSQVGTTSGTDKQVYSSNDGVHQLNGTLGSTANSGFRGHAIITDPMKVTSDQGVTVTTICMMHYGGGTQEHKWSERGFSNADHNTTPSGGFKDLRMGIIDGNASGSNVTNTNARTVFGTMSIYGVR